MRMALHMPEVLQCACKANFQANAQFSSQISKGQCEEEADPNGWPALTCEAKCRYRSSNAHGPAT